MRSQTISLPAYGYSVTQTYAYNNLNQLLGAAESAASPATGWAQGFGYINGNMYVQNNTGLPAFTNETPQGPGWFADSNRITGWSYDPVGNVTSVANMARTFVYDAANRQVSATINAATTERIVPCNSGGMS